MPKALFLEGGDSVGKNDAFRSLVVYLIQKYPQQKLVLMNFPQFWFFGHDVRLVMRGACDELLEPLSGVENVHVRAALYGLDRNIALLLAEPFLEKEEYLVISDRGPYSSCVTTGYVWANKKITKEDVVTSIVPHTFQRSDWGMLNYFTHTSVLCSIEGGFSNSGLHSRKALDNYESELPQQHSYEVYRMLGLPTVVTKTSDGKWRSRQDIVNELCVYMGIAEPFDSSVPIGTPQDTELLIQAYAKGHIVLIGPEVLLRHFGLWSRIDHRLRTMIQKWTRISLGESTGDVRDRKEVLDDLETKIALALKRLTGAFHYSLARHSPHAKHAIHQLLAQYPLINRLLKQTSGGRMGVFLQGILGPEQLHFTFP